MPRLVCLDGLRGVLACYVMVSHMAPFAILPGWIASALSHGGAAVDVFFILSGMVITGSLARVSWQGRPFLAARVVRIFPAYLPVLLLAIAVQPLASGFDDMPWIAHASRAHAVRSEGWPADWCPELIAHITMTHGLFPAGLLPDVWISFLGAAWSLSVEWQFYVLVLVAGRTQLINRNPCRLAAAFLLLGLAGLVWRTVGPEAWQFSRAFLPNKAHYFALGISAAQLIRDRSWQGYALALAGTTTLIGSEGAEKLLTPLLWSVCLAAQMRAAGLGLLRGVLQSVPLVWLGELSYAIYLVNEPIQKLIGLGLARLAAGNAALFMLFWCPLSIAIPLVAAVWLHRWIEVPALQWGRRVMRECAGVRVTV